MFPFDVSSSFTLIPLHYAYNIIEENYPSFSKDKILYRKAGSSRGAENAEALKISPKHIFSSLKFPHN